MGLQNFKNHPIATIFFIVFIISAILFGVLTILGTVSETGTFSCASNECMIAKNRVLINILFAWVIYELKIKRNDN